jgi:hypothetical protein
VSIGWGAADTDVSARATRVGVDELHVVCIRLWQRRHTVSDRGHRADGRGGHFDIRAAAEFSAAAEGRSPNNVLMVVGYIVMGVPLIVL